MKNYSRNLPLTAISLATAALISACGGGGSIGTGPTTFSGAVIDGYITGATVCLDLNKNLACDAGEPSAVSGANGAYSFTVPATTDLRNLAELHLIAVVPATARDSDNPTSQIVPFTLLAPAEMPSAITPLTTAVSDRMINKGESLANARINTRNDLSLPPSYDFAKDHVAANDTKAHNVAKVVAAYLAVNVGTDTPNATNLAAALTLAKGYSSDAFNSPDVIAKVSEILGTPTPTPTPTPSTAQVTFDTGDTSGFALVDFGGAASTVAAGPAGGNGQAVEVTKGVAGTPSEVWAGTTFLDLASGEFITPANHVVTIRVWSPAAGKVIRLKLEDKNAPGNFVEIDKTTTVANGWETLSFDATTPATAALNDGFTFNRASIFFDFGTAGTGQVYYFDDVSFGAATATPTPSTAQVTFDTGDTSGFALVDFGGAASTVAADPAGGNGQAVEVIKGASGTPSEIWAGTTFLDLASGEFITPANHVVTIRVWSPAAGKVIRLKLEDKNAAGNFVEIDKTTTVANGWETLSFDATTPATAALNDGFTFNRASIFFDFGTAGTGQVYYFDDVSFGGATPTPTGTNLVTFDEATAPAFVGFNGADSSAIAAGPAGGNGNALQIVRKGGDPWAGAKVTGLPITLSATNATISARVYIPVAGVRFVLKLEGGGAASAEVNPNESTVAGWQTLTWTFAGGDRKTWADLVFLPNLGTVASVNPGETYYVDDVQILGTVTVNPGGPTPNPTAAMGSAGPVEIPVASAGDGFLVATDAVFARDYIGTLDANGNNAGWETSVTRGVASNGNIGFFNDATLDTTSQKLDANGWVVGLIDNPGGVPNFFRFFVLTEPASTFANSFMGLWVNAPNNGTVDVSTYGSIKFRAWGPAEMFQVPGTDPTLEIILSGPKVTGCTTTGSGGTELKKSFVANQKIGAASTYTVSLAGWAVNGVCGTDTAATAFNSVLTHLARVTVNVPASSFNWTKGNPDTPVSYSTGLNLGPIAFSKN